ncbi:MAG: ASKHA domain-containing protein [Bryobacteraceae bacterium]
MAATLTINGHSIEASPAASIFDHAETLGIHVPTSCHKQGKCKECMVEVTEGAELLSERTEEERHLSGKFRLSCRTKVAAASGEVRCHTMRRGTMRVETESTGLPVELRGIGLDPAVVRDGERILLDGEEIERAAGPLYGIAMDLGTTTVVLRLFDLETGARIADASFENPQRFGGSDVMSRIHYDCEHPGKLLRRTLAGYLSHAIEEFPVAPSSIYEMVVVGNSTMRDLFFGQSVYSIGQNPYRSITEIEMAEGKRATTSLSITGRQALLPIHPRARVYGVPIISGHVGADAAACLLAVDMAHEDRLIALMDIGTNTELIVGNRHRILAASCPAGPAFEGGAIACGMPALDGAIEDVWGDAAGNLQVRVIGGGPPQGICGSGLIALLSELLRTGRMNAMGRFVDGAGLADGDGGRIALDRDGGVFFLENDASELAQAKGAHVAGLQVVAGSYGVEFGDIEVFYLAGGFGRNLSVEAATRIGLIPKLPASRVVQAGNAAIEGASRVLLSMAKRRELEGLVRKVEHCRLETHPHFFDLFVEGCQFKPLEAVEVAG